MARPKDYSELIVWRKAMALARDTYRVTNSLPKNESYGLLSQIRRAAIFVPSNVAEGHGRLTDTQFRHFLGNARGSLYELQTQLRLAIELGLLENGRVHELLKQAQEVARFMNGFISALRRSEGANSASTASAATS